ncbi:MAG: nitroreductase family protein [Lachnospiraceae bacterium]|nr:nitroreductase family protein [Lachnospiraceae bacterium]
MLKRIKNYLKKHGVLSKYGYKLAYRQYSRFLEYAISGKDIEDTAFLETNLRIYIHELEKGFSLPMPKRGFGKEKVALLVEYYEKYVELGEGVDTELIQYVQDILAFYEQNKKEYAFDVSMIPENLRSKDSRKLDAGIKQIGKNDLFEVQKWSFEKFSETRHSIRMFKDEKIEEDLIKQAVRLAQTAPSACNRQSVEIFHISSADKCKEILDLQGGFKGASVVNDLLIITSNLSLYTSLYELNTGYVDGGIFAMNLMYALHYYGIGSCPLLWNDDCDKREKIRDMVKIPMKNMIVLLLPIGNYVEPDYKYAVSKRKPVKKIYHKI